MLKKTLIIILVMCLLACEQESDVSYESLKLFPQGKSFSGFQLTDQNNKTINQETFTDHTSVVFFGFTNCPDICPTTLMELKKTDKILRDNGVKQPQMVFISVDPDRDHSDNLKTYIEYFNPAFTAATGDSANILSLASQLGVAYHVAEHDDNQMIYDVDHSSALFLINDRGERIGIFPAPHHAKTLAADLSLYMEQQK